MPAEILRCPNCSANNRVDLDRVRAGAAPVCGRCGTPLPLPSPAATSHEGVLEATDHSFPSLVERSPIPVLLDLWAPWCGPCRMIAPIVEQLASEFAGRIRFAKLNVDNNQSTAARFHVDGIPTLLLLNRGQEVDRIVGVVPAPQIRQRLDALLQR